MLERPDQLNIARLAFGAYQAHAEKPAAVESWVDPNGKQQEAYYGMVNPCLYGDQCESHAVYCNNNAAPWTKCHRSWYYGGERYPYSSTHDEEDEGAWDQDCPYFAPSPHWQGAEGEDYYAAREKTVAHLREQGLLEERVSE